MREASIEIVPEFLRVAGQASTAKKQHLVKTEALVREDGGLLRLRHVR